MVRPWPEADIALGRSAPRPRQVAQFFAEFAQTAETEQLEPREFIVQGERVVVLGYRRDRVKATDRIFESEWVQVFSLRTGKIVSFQGDYDTAAMVAAFRGD